MYSKFVFIKELVIEDINFKFEVGSVYVGYKYKNGGWVKILTESFNNSIHIDDGFIKEI